VGWVAFSESNAEPRQSLNNNSGILTEARILLERITAEFREAGFLPIEIWDAFLLTSACTRFSTLLASAMLALAECFVSKAIQVALLGCLIALSKSLHDAHLLGLVHSSMVAGLSASS